MVLTSRKSSWGLYHLPLFDSTIFADLRMTPNIQWFCEGIFQYFRKDITIYILFGLPCSTEPKQNIIGSKLSKLPSDRVTKIKVSQLPSFQVTKFPGVKCFEFSGFQVFNFTSYQVQIHNYRGDWMSEEILKNNCMQSQNTHTTPDSRRTLRLGD